MEETGYSRKLDTMGRIMLPIRLREQLGLIIGHEYDFFMYVEPDGRKFLCIECPSIKKEEIEQARKIVAKFGM
ncbi:MAG: division/cell wall cluster transcriptional repressor MraZ [Lachnospiraceae bacterium]|nr:division/cell wall cluster transcriptional repressor MraZ [Lachnospiraceae bacterium]